MRFNDLVDNENLIGWLQEAFALLSPMIDMLIVKYQADYLISEVSPDSFSFGQAYNEWERQGVISECECHQYVKCGCTSRFEVLYGNAHGLPIYLIHVSWD